MGNNKTKQLIEATTEATEVTHSSGFHVVEIHLPASSGGILLIIGALIIAIPIMVLLLHCCKRKASPTLPFFYQDPSPPQHLQYHARDAAQHQSACMQDPRQLEGIHAG
jgi:hypothetical protein